MKRKLRKWWQVITGRRAQQLAALRRQRLVRDLDRMDAQLEQWIEEAQPGHRLHLINAKFRLRMMRSFRGL